MAEAVTAAVAWLGAEIGGTVGAHMIMYATEIAYTAAAVATLSTGESQRRRAARRARDLANASQRDREVMIRSAIAPRRCIYGTDRVSGPLVFAETSGDAGEILHLVIALAGHRCGGMRSVWFGDVELPQPDADGYIRSGPFVEWTAAEESLALHSDASGRVTLPSPQSLGGTTLGVTAILQGAVVLPESGAPDAVSGWTQGNDSITGLAPDTDYLVYLTVNSGRPMVRVRFWDGRDDGMPFPELAAACPDRWNPSRHLGRGVSALYVELRYVHDVLAQIGLPAISAVVDGKPVWDPRTRTHVSSNNSALVTADWLRDSVYGMGAAGLEVPDDELAGEANICDEPVSVGDGQTQRRYTFDGSFTTDQAPADVLQALLGSMSGDAVWTGGRWKIRAGAHRAPVHTITEDDLAGESIKVVVRPGRAALYNGVRAVHRDPSRGWAEVQAPVVTSDFYRDEDGGTAVTRTITVSTAADTWRAQRLARIELERARQAMTVELHTSLRGYGLPVADTVGLKLAALGSGDNAKVFVLRERTYDVDAGRITAVLRETSADVWDWNGGTPASADTAPNTSLPSPYVRPPALRDLACASGTQHLLRQADGTIISRALVTWGASSDRFVIGGGHIECEWRDLASSQDWQPTPRLTGDSVECYIGPLPDGRPIMVRVRQVNSVGRTSAWATRATLVVGKTEPPSTVVGAAYAQSGHDIHLSWERPPDLDYADTILRVGPSFGAGITLFQGAATSASWPSPAVGAHVVWMAHRDSSGNIGPATRLDVVVARADDAPGALAILDTRSVSLGPKDYPAGQRTTEFKYCSVLGIMGASQPYCTLETLKSWSDASGGHAIQWAYVTSAEVWKRSARHDGEGWEAWVRDVDRSLYTGDLDALNDIVIDDVDEVGYSFSSAA